MEAVVEERQANLTEVLLSQELTGTLRNSTVVAFTTLYPIFESTWCMVLKPNLKHALKIT